MGDQVYDGLFQILFDEICEKLKTGGRMQRVTARYAELGNDEARVRCILDLDEFQDTVRVSSFLQEKSTETSLKLRSEGNELFKNKEFEKALDFYNESVLTAPCTERNGLDNTVLALAFGNRSSALFRLRKYELCLYDIQLAIENGYPDNLSYKLYQRKGKCLAELDMNEEAKCTFTKAKEMLEYSNLADDKRNELIDKLDVFENGNAEATPVLLSNGDYELCDATHSTCAIAMSCTTNEPFESLIAEDKPYIIGTSPERGRHTLATRDIRAGEVIMVDRPYASILLPDKYATHCHHCFNRTEAPLPCVQCTIVRFCSKTCRDNAWSTYHGIECKCLGYLLISEIGKFGLLAFRTITISSLKDYVSTVRNMKMNNGENKPTFVEDIIVDGYNSIYLLETHTADRHGGDLFWRGVLSAFLTKCLAYCGYFCSNDNGQHMTENMALIGGLILRHLQSLPCNSRAITKNDESVLDNAQFEEIGEAIYGCVSLFNHSCDPSVVCYFKNDTCVVKTIRPVLKGEEVNVCYINNCTGLDRKARNTILQTQYFFKCSCNSCSLD